MSQMRKIDWQRLRPAYWYQNEPTDWEWDTILNRLLDRHTPKIGYLTVSLGGVDVWTSNFPYAYGYCYNPKNRGLPSVATRKRLRDAVEKEERSEFRAAIAKAEGQP